MFSRPSTPAALLMCLLGGISQVVGCTKTETSMIAPAADSRCQLQASGTPTSFGPSGGSGSMNIVAARDCTWAVTGEPAWISIGGDRAGQGDAVVSFTVAANPTPSSRSGGLKVGAQTLQVNQDAAPCRFDLSRTQATIGREGGRLTVDVTTLTGCRWTTSSNATWISIASGQTADASATVALDVAANSGIDRVGTVIVAGLTFTITQSAVSPPEAPPVQPPPPAATPPPSVPPPTPPPPTVAPPAATPPPSPVTVQFEGVNSKSTGKCPIVTFTVSANRVVTTSGTDYDRMNCGDLDKQRTIQVTGLRAADGLVTATRILRPRNDD
jgi:all-beta uncharacterized protein